MMKKLFTLIFTMICLSVTAQRSDTLKLKHFNTWSGSVFLGGVYSNVDLDLNDPFYTKTAISSGVGFNIAKQLSHYSSLQANYFSSTLTGEGNKSNFETKINQLDARLQFNITNGHTLKNWRSTQIYAYIGYGILWYDALRTFTDNTDSITIKSNTNIIPVGLGFKYRLGNRTNLYLDVSYNRSNTDKLDGHVNVLTAMDGYTKGVLGFSYTFGKKRILEWDNPYVYLVPEVVHDTTTIIQRIEYIAPKPEIIEKDSAIIYFTPGSWEIEMPYLDELDKLIERARKTNQSLLIQAYVDATGAPKTNVEVVTKRGDKIAQYVKKFISSEKINIELYDETYAAYAPDARNRKVVVKIVQ